MDYDEHASTSDCLTTRTIIFKAFSNDGNKSYRKQRQISMYNRRLVH